MIVWGVCAVGCWSSRRLGVVPVVLAGESAGRDLVWALLDITFLNVYNFNFVFPLPVSPGLALFATVDPRPNI